MNLTNRLILKMGERTLFPFRSNETFLRMPEFAGYQELLPQIKNIYEQTGYWHGTGRYQYAHSAATRYESLDFTATTDLLGSIILAGGLLPHEEPWLRKIQKIAVPTVSLSPFRMYAKLYAGLYLYEKDAMAYEFGTRKYWFRMLLRVQMLDTNFLKFLFPKGLFRLARISTFQNAKLWVRSIRKDGGHANLLQGHLIRSDISGNYPILIGIKKHIKRMDFNPGMERLEVRTSEPIRFVDMTHIEVPLAQVGDTKNFLKQYNVELLVIPLEYGEMYCSSKTLQELVGM